jgi:hypothetical protein
MIWIDHVTVSFRCFLYMHCINLDARLNVLLASTSSLESLLPAESLSPTAILTDLPPGPQPAMDVTTGLFTSLAPTT